MNFKRLLKFTLSGLLLTATATAYAAEGEATAEPAVVQLANNAGTITWTEFANYINNPSSIPGGTISEEIQTAYDKAVSAQETASADEETATNAFTNAQKNLTQWQARLSALGNTKAPFDWLKQAYEKAEDFEIAFDKVLASSSYENNTVKVWYLYQTEGRADVVTISYGDTKPTNNFSTDTPSTEFVQVGETEFWTALKGKTIDIAYIYVGADNYSSNNGRIKVGQFRGQRQKSVAEANRYL